MKKLLVKILMWYYRKDEFKKPLDKLEQEKLLKVLANFKDLQDFPTYLDQCITNARNRYMYTNDPVFKGAVMAYSFLKEEIAKYKSDGEPQRELTQEEKVGIMRRRGY